MTNNCRIYIARALLPFVLAFSCYFPRPANAAIPLLVAFAIAGVGTGTSITVPSLTAAGVASALVGTSLLALILTPSSLSDGPVLRAPTSTSASSTAAIPPPPVTNTSFPVPTVYSSGSVCGSVTGGTVAAACAAASASCAGTYYGAPGFTHTVATYMFNGSCKADYTLTDNSSGNVVASNPALDIAMTPVQVCPSGYSQSGAVCNLANPRQAVPDSKVDVGRSGTTLSPLADADSSKLKITYSSTTNPNDTVTITGKDDAGNPQQVSTQALSGGGSLIKVTSQKTDANGNSFVNNNIYQTDSAGTVVSGSGTSVKGQLAVNTAGTLDYTGDGTTFNPAANPTASASFPSDYARSGEAAAAASIVSQSIQTLAPKLDQIHTDLTQTSAAPADPSYTDGWTDLKDSFANLSGWSVPGHASQCPVGDFSAFGRLFVIDSHCTLVANHWGALQASLVVVWSILALFIVLRA